MPDATRMSIVGIGVSELGRAIARPLAALAIEATLAACADAGIDPKSIDGLLSESSHFHSILPDIQAALGLGAGTFSAHIGLHGSGAVATPLLAAPLASAGLATTFLCVYGVSLSSEGGPGSYHSSDEFKANAEIPIGYFPQPVYMACMANRYLHVHGYKADALGAVAISARAWSTLHPTAQRPKPIAMADYLAAPMIADPLRSLDCCLIGDGAAAFILTTTERARDLRHRPVHVAGGSRAVEPVAEHEYLGVRSDQSYLPSRWSGPAAFRSADLSPRDIDIAYLYDCFSIIPVIQLEDAGLCEPGQGLELFTSGQTLPGGRLPVNTHGGMMAHSNLPGIGMIVEAVEQLRQDAGSRQVVGARTAFIGSWAAQDHTSLILTAAA